jgi:cobalt/nickel transport system ATP-binding protein
MIDLENVGVSYGEGRGLTGVNLSIRPGERVVLLGANGCGKSTLLKVMDGLVLPDRGQYRFDGETVDGTRLRNRAWAYRFRRRVALMFQHAEAMLFNSTVAEEIGYGLRHLPPAEIRERVEHWAGTLGLSPRLDNPPSALSGGEKQRLCLACLLVLEPEVLLLDEPTANLDPRTVGWLIHFLAGQRITTVIATHHLALAPELGSRAVILSESHQVVFDGPVEEALADQELLLANNLAYRHRHRHGDIPHEHVHLLCSDGLLAGKNGKCCK